MTNRLGCQYSNSSLNGKGAINAEPGSQQIGTVAVRPDHICIDAKQFTSF